MAAAPSIAGWVSRNWKKGWEEIPLLMCAHCITVPLFVGTIGAYLFTDWIPRTTVEKYRYTYTVMRPDDPRVATIQRYSKYDRVGPFS